MAYGASEEIGPFRINKTASGLYVNKFSWNKLANLLFLETPAGVGFSYSNRSSDLLDTGDYRTGTNILLTQFRPSLFVLLLFNYFLLAWIFLLHPLYSWNVSICRLIDHQLWSYLGAYFLTPNVVIMKWWWPSMCVNKLWQSAHLGACDKVNIST